MPKRVLFSIVNAIESLSGEYIQHGYEDLMLSKWTMTTRKTHMKQFVFFCTVNNLIDVTEVDNRAIDLYFREFTKSHNQSTANTARRILKSFFTWIESYKELPIKVHPDAIRLVKINNNAPCGVNRVDVLRAIQAAKHKQDALMIAVTFEAGLRISEVVSIKIKDISPQQIQVVGKGSIERTVYITERLSSVLFAYIKSEGLTDDDRLFRPVYHNSTLSYLTITSARRRMKRCFEDVGIDMHPHQLRHGIAIDLLKSGCDLVTIQKVLGHEHISTTMIYLRVDDKHLREQYSKYMGSSVIA